MKLLILFFLMLVLTNCNNNKSVYWCGDHPCVNKKEKENYFKETMIVEVKTLNKKSKMSKSDFQKIKAQAKANSKKIAKSYGAIVPFLRQKKFLKYEYS